MAAMTIIRIAGTDLEAECLPGETMLTALHRASHAMRTGCRRGGCGICRIDVLDGTFEYTHPVAESVVSTEERGRGVCLTCRAVPTSDMVVSLSTHDARVSSLYAWFRNRDQH